MKFGSLTESREKYLPFVGIGVCVILTVLVYIGGVRSLMNQQEDIALRRAKSESLRTREQELSGRLVAVKEKLSLVREELAQTPLKLQSSANANRRLGRLDDLASQSSVNLSATELNAPLTGAQYKIVPIDLVGDATYQACAIFLHKLTEEFSDMALWSMELSRGSASPPGQITFRIHVIWFAGLESLGDSDRAAGIKLTDPEQDVAV